MSFMQQKNNMKEPNLRPVSGYSDPIIPGIPTPVAPAIAPAAVLLPLGRHEGGRGLSSPCRHSTGCGGLREKSGSH
jgi:hypothetical protein